jgi:hypothetical protein
VYFRLLVPAIVWLVIMMLIVFREYREQSSEAFFGFSQSTFFQFVLFLGFAHIWKGVLMKQLKYRELKDRSNVIVILSGILLSVLIEIIRWKAGLSNDFNVVNLVMNISGVLTGLVAFRLVYSSTN